MDGGLEAIMVSSHGHHHGAAGGRRVCGFRRDRLAGVFGVKELFAVVDRWLDGASTFLPVRGADFAVGFKELQCFDHPQGFVNASAQWQVIDDLMANNAVFVDQEQATHRHTTFKQDVVVTRDLLVQVRDQGVADFADAAFVAGTVGPGQVREVTVDGDTQDLHVFGCEVAFTIAEGNDFSGADKGEVQRVEEQDDVLAAIVA